MRLPLAIDRFLAQMELEHDWTPRTKKSVFDCLVLLADENPEARLSDFSGRVGTDILREHIGRHFGHRAASTRATRISYHHTFWAWAEDEGFLDDDPARRIKRPPKRRADVYRPTSSELELFERSCTIRELGAWALMGRRGFRASTVVAVRWQDIDLQQGRVRVVVKGGHRDWAPLGPMATAILQHVYRSLEPAPEHHVFTAEVERWVTSEHRIRTEVDPTAPLSTRTLWRMVDRVCKRAGIRHLGPHALRHGFATGFLRDSDRDTASLQRLLGHARIDTTQGYTDELDLDELEEALDRAAEKHVSQSPGLFAVDDEEPAISGVEAAGIEPASAEQSEGAAASPDSDASDPRLDLSQSRADTSARAHEGSDTDASA